MKKSLVFVTIALLLVPGASPAGSDVESLVKSVRNAVDPPVSMTRTIKMTIAAADGGSVQWTGRQARKQLIEGRRAMVTVLLGPDSVKGFAVLSVQEGDEDAAHWMYLPPVRRVRRIVQDDVDRHFLGTDFTVADLTFADFSGRTVSDLGEDKLGDDKVRKIRIVPDDPIVYSKIEAWVSTENFLPLRKEFFDRGGTLWRTEEVTRAANIDGMPTILSLVMTDEQNGGSSRLEVTDVNYKKAVADKVFDPANLPEVAAGMIW